jgi:hypothetical protein
MMDSPTNPTVRLMILECASEDCYALVEFIESLVTAYPSGQRQENLALIKGVLRQLSDDGLVRVHWANWGEQCTPGNDAPETMTVRGAEIEGLPEEMRDVSSDKLLVCVHGTDLTFDAYNRAYLELHPESAT